MSHRAKRLKITRLRFDFRNSRGGWKYHACPFSRKLMSRHEAQQNGHTCTWFFHSTQELITSMRKNKTFQMNRTNFIFDFENGIF